MWLFLGSKPSTAKGTGNPVQAEQQEYQLFVKVHESTGPYVIMREMKALCPTSRLTGFGDYYGNFAYRFSVPDQHTADQCELHLKDTDLCHGVSYRMVKD